MEQLWNQSKGIGNYRSGLNETVNVYVHCPCAEINIDQLYYKFLGGGLSNGPLCDLFQKYLEHYLGIDNPSLAAEIM